MHMLKQIKREQIINSALLAKLKLINGLASPLKVKDRLEPKWKSKVYFLTQETINQCNLPCTSTLICGKSVEMKQLCLFKD